jgi:hypothetical protein
MRKRQLGSTFGGGYQTIEHPENDLGANQERQEFKKDQGEELGQKVAKTWMWWPTESEYSSPANHSVVFSLIFFTGVISIREECRSCKLCCRKFLCLGSSIRVATRRGRTRTFGVLAALLSGVADPLVGMVWAVHMVLLPLEFLGGWLAPLLWGGCPSMRTCCPFERTWASWLWNQWMSSWLISRQISASST